MSRLLVVGLLALSGDEAATPPTFAARAAEIAAHVDGGRWQDALAAADAALTDAQGFSETELAELQFARGVILYSRELESSQAGAASEPAEPGLPTARAAFSSARALGGPTSLRLDATYDMGLCAFQEGERARSELPEISGAPPGGPAGIPMPASVPLPPGPDPLAVARAAYTQAKEIFVERLRADWRDEDTRANLELLERRLDELDAIEKKREQEKEPQEEQDPKEDRKDGEQKPPEEGDPKPDSEPGKPEDSKPEPGQAPEGEKPPETPEQEPPGKEPPEPEPESPPQEAPPGEEDPQEAGAPQEAPPEEVHLTREEVQQLLDKLAELEKQAGALEAALRSARRVPVTRDW